MTAAFQPQHSFRIVYYVGSGAKFMACVLFPMFGTTLLVYFFSNLQQLRDVLFDWQTNLIGGIVVLGGFALSMWTIAFILWIPLRSFVFPPRSEGILVSTSVYEVRRGRPPIVDIAIGDVKLCAHTNPELIRVLQQIQRGSHVRVTSGPKTFIVRVEVAP